MRAVTSEVLTDLGPELTAFRAEMRAWIQANAPEGLADQADWYDGATILTGSNRDAQARGRESAPYLAWDALLTRERMVYPHWPEHAGGRGWSEVQTAIFAEECHRAGVPRVKRGFSADLVGTAVLRFGTQEQQADFLPRIVDGVDRYCQGFSEPNHGSDFGAIETTGTVVGDEIVITGQKVWTSDYEPANMIFVVVRTDPDAHRSAALTFVLVPFRDNSIEVRGIRQPTGAADFAEDFFDGARAPLSHVIGGIGNGWAVAQATLATERTADVLTSHLGYGDEFQAVLAMAREGGRTHDPVYRQRLAQAFVDTQVMRARAAIALTMTAAGDEPTAIGFLSKLFWSEYGVRLGELAMDICGPAAAVRPDAGAPEVHPIDPRYALSRWQDLLIASRGATVFSGSNEIQRNIIAEQVLGLPREPRGKPAPSRAAVAMEGVA